MDNSTVNWEEVRINASINIMNAILSSSIMVFIFQFIFKRQVADTAVEYADKLIEELKKRRMISITLLKLSRSIFLISLFLSLQ